MVFLILSMSGYLVVYVEYRKFDKLVDICYGRMCISCGADLPNLDHLEHEYKFCGHKCISCNRDSKILLISDHFLFDRFRIFIIKSSYCESNFKRLSFFIWGCFIFLSIFIGLVNLFIFPILVSHFLFLSACNFIICSIFIVDVLSIYFISKIKWTN
jgi:hypothetical protein